MVPQVKEFLISRRQFIKDVFLIIGEAAIGSLETAEIVRAQ